MKLLFGSKKSARSPDHARKAISTDEVLARNQAARRNSRPLLDPHGIYGTRSAYRVRAAKSRRRVQAAAVLGSIAIALLGGASYLREHRVPLLARGWRHELVALPSGQPTWANLGAGAPSLLVPTESGSLLAVDGASGESTTLFKADFALRAQPLVAENLIFAAGEDGTFFAYDWKRARLLWKHQGGAAISARPVAILMATPVTSATLPPASANPRTAAAIGVVVGDDRGGVVALESVTGRVLWKQDLHVPVGNGLSSDADVTATSPIASKVFVPLLAGEGSAGGVACLNAATGRVLWNANLGAPTLPAPAIEPAGQVQHLYCVCDDGKVVCLDKSSGRLLWKLSARPLRGAPNAAVVLRGEAAVVAYTWGARLVFGGNDGVVRCVDAGTGQLMWAYATGAAVRSVPLAMRLTIDGAQRDAIVVGSDGPGVFALDAKSGRPLWRCRTAGSAFAAPGIVGSTAVCLTREGDFQSFELP